MDRSLTAPEMKWKGTYSSNYFQSHLQWEKEWILPLVIATVLGSNTFSRIFLEGYLITKVQY